MLVEHRRVLVRWNHNHTAKELHLAGSCIPASYSVRRSRQNGGGREGVREKKKSFFAEFSNGRYCRTPELASRLVQTVSPLHCHNPNFHKPTWILEQHNPQARLDTLPSVRHSLQPPQKQANEAHNAAAAAVGRRRSEKVGFGRTDGRTDGGHGGGAPH